MQLHVHKQKETIKPQKVALNMANLIFMQAGFGIF
jgi:hypothetical protein